MIDGRIIRSIGGLYFVDTINGLFECKARGVFRKRRISPVVGDYVAITILDCKKMVGFIERVFERKTFLARPKIANVDCCVITFAGASPSINFDLLDRFLVLAEEKKLEIVICVNKLDIIKADVVEYIKRIYLPVYKVVFTDTFSNVGINDLKVIIEKKISVLAGPSGVGKSSIINKIVPFGAQKTGEISKKIERGKHTTREVELICIDEGTYIADSPGFTSLRIEHIKPEEIQFYFREFLQFIGKCRFNDCLHLNEPDCAVKENIGKFISRERYERYEFLYDELHRK